MLLAVVNLLLSFTEGITLWLCIYLFMKHNRQEIFRRRFWYALGFSAAGIGFYALTFWMNRIGAVWIPVIFFLRGAAAWAEPVPQTELEPAF